MSKNYDDLFDETETMEDVTDLGNADYTEAEKTYTKAHASTGKPRKKAARVTATALAFGLIAGSVFYGTNRTLNAVFPQGKTIAAGSATAGSGDSSQALLNISESGQVNRTEVNASGTVAEVAEKAMPSLVTISCTSVEVMEDMYNYFGQNGIPDLGDFFGNPGRFFDSNSRSHAYQDPSSGAAYEQEVSSCGTGVIVGQNEDELLIATNNHVVAGATTLSVGFLDETAVNAEVKGTDPSTDLAIVSVKIADIPQETLNQIAVASIGDSDSLSLGEQVVAIGNALGYGQSVTSGIISAFNRNLTLSDEAGGTMESTGLIQTDASINAGNSGGGLFNMKGELIAINEAKSSSGSGQASVDNMGFAIPTAKALPILNSLMNGEAVPSGSENATGGYLGIRCSDVSEEASQMYGLPIGVSIVAIEENSPAAAYGLKTGDVITEFNGQKITSSNELKAALDLCNSGDSVDLTVYRSNEGEYNPVQFSIILDEAQQNQQ